MTSPDYTYTIVGSAQSEIHSKSRKTIGPGYEGTGTYYGMMTDAINRAIITLPGEYYIVVQEDGKVVEVFGPIRVVTPKPILEVVTP